MMVVGNLYVSTTKGDWCPINAQINRSTSSDKIICNDWANGLVQRKLSIALVVITKEYCQKMQKFTKWQMASHKI